MTLDELHALMTEGFQKVDERFERIETELKAEIKAEGATTRRFFDIMTEKVEAAVSIVAEATAHHATALDNHENRLQVIEKRG